VITELGALFDETDVDRVVMEPLFLLQSDGRCQASDSTSDDNDIVLHLLARRQIAGEGEKKIFRSERRENFFCKNPDHFIIKSL
jgi:hypothetical protein